MLTTRLVHPFARGQLVSREAARQLVEYGEILVGDSRLSLTIAQMVEDKVLAMLGSGARCFRPFKNAVGRRSMSYDSGPATPSALALSGPSAIKAERKESNKLR